MSEKISLDSSASFSVCVPSAAALVKLLATFFTEIVSVALFSPVCGWSGPTIGSSSFEHAANAQAIIVPNNKFLSSIGEWL